MPGTNQAQTCAHCEAVVRRLHALADEPRPGRLARSPQRVSLVCRLCFIRLTGIEPHRARVRRG